MKRLPQEIIENLAQKFRTEQGISISEAINMKSLLQKLNVLTLYRPLSEYFYGISLKSSQGSNFLLVNSNDTIGRQHYTIAHELYHLFYEETSVPHICNEESGGKNTSEYNADAFAAAFLMPKEGLLQFISAEDIKKRNISLALVIRLEQYFSVSRISLLLRLKLLNLITSVVFDGLNAIPVKESARLHGYNTALYESGNEYLVIGDFGEKARTLYEKNIISEGHYIELLNSISNAKD